LIALMLSMAFANALARFRRWSSPSPRRGLNNTMWRIIDAGLLWMVAEAQAGGSMADHFWADQLEAYQLSVDHRGVDPSADHRYVGDHWEGDRCADDHCAVDSSADHRYVDDHREDDLHGGDQSMVDHREGDRCADDHGERGSKGGDHSMDDHSMDDHQKDDSRADGRFADVPLA
jgi:hypothetical protein